jgi:hypothetical protein
LFGEQAEKNTAIARAQAKKRITIKIFAKVMGQPIKNPPVFKREDSFDSFL